MTPKLPGLLATLSERTARVARTGRPPTLHIAHRGGSALAPENTLLAFGQAVARHRTDMLELDVRPTADGELVVFHDDDLARCTDASGPLEDLTLAELAQLDAAHRFTLDAGRTYPLRGQGVRVPRFVEVLAAFPELLLNVELKRGPRSAGAVGTLVKCLRDAGAVDRVCLGSEDDTLGAALADALPEGCHFFPAGALAALVLALKQRAAAGLEPEDREPAGRRAGPKPGVGEPAGRRAGGVSIEPAAPLGGVDGPFHVLDMPSRWEGVPLIDAPFLAACRARALWVNCWTVDETSEMRYLVDAGVGGIMTDRPDRLRAVLDGRADSEIE